VPSLQVKRLVIPWADEVQEELEAEHAALLARVEARERRGYSSGFRCWGCGLFVGSRTGACPHCGQLHGGQFHDAYPTR
jgi:hypothetical protein